MSALIELTSRLRSLHDLSTAEVESAVAALAAPTVDDETKAAFLIALADKGESAAEIAAFAMAGMTKAPSYLPDDLSAVLAHTKTLGPNESDRIEFHAPTDPGEYPFLCTFPGHFALMKGKLIVK